MAYLFTSERLGFRMWEESDFSFFEEMNANPEVMKHFPSILTEEESRGWFEKMFEHYEKHGYVYFLVEQLSDQTPIGFIGMAYQDYESICTPAVDIGWRLIPSVWGKGYATEGATRCAEYSFETLKIDRLIATCVLQNKPSEKVMQNIGMTRKGTFKHPKLKEYPDLEECLWYEIRKTN